jgi:hypothetical protein
MLIDLTDELTREQAVLSGGVASTDNDQIGLISSAICPISQPSLSAIRTASEPSPTGRCLGAAQLMGFGTHTIWPALLGECKIIRL